MANRTRGQPHRRDEMVRRDIAGRGIQDERVVDAMATVHREEFVSGRLAGHAYEDRPLPIEVGQTISQPYIVALMAEAAEVEPGDRVLEVGTGSGYGAAVLSLLAAEVWTIERHGALADSASARLARLGYDNVHVSHGDGILGLPAHAPFDAIVVTAAASEVPSALTDQLADGGRLVMPVGRRHQPQRLVRIRRRGDELAEEMLADVRFVPLLPGD